MSSDEAAVLIYVDADVGRLVAVERAFAAPGVRLATATSVAHADRVLARTRGTRLVAVDASSVDVTQLAALLTRSREKIALVLMTSEGAQRERLARERGIIAMFSRAGPAEAIARRLASALLLPVSERVTLATVLRVAAASRATLAVRTEGPRRGTIWLETGRIVHAELGESSGPDAVVAMLADAAVDVIVERDARTRARTVQFDIDVFLSSFDLPDDEPELELVIEDEGAPPSSRESITPGGGVGVLAEAIHMDGFVSAALIDARAHRAMARVGFGVAPDAEHDCPEASFWAALTGGADLDIEDVVAHTPSDIFLFVPHAGVDGRVLCLQLDAASTNLSLAKLEARRIAALEPALHDLVLTFGSAHAEIAKSLP